MLRNGVPARFRTSPAVYEKDYAKEQSPEDPSMVHKLQEPTIEHLFEDYAMEHLTEEEPPLEYFPRDDPPMESLTIDDLPMEHLNQETLPMDYFVRGLNDSCIDGRSDIQGSFIFDPGPTLLNLCDSLDTLDTFALHPTDVIMCTLSPKSNGTLEPFYGYVIHPEESLTAGGIQELIEGE